MSSLLSIRSACERDLVVAFTDLTQYGALCKRLSDTEQMECMSAYYQFLQQIVEQDDGLIIKFMGDAALIIWPAEMADAALSHLQDVKALGDRWLQDRGYASRHIIKAHRGPVSLCPVRTQGEAVLDVFGKTVMTAAVLESDSLAVSVQFFRSLSPESRQALKKHTPPITYIPLQQQH